MIKKLLLPLLFFFVSTVSAQKIIKSEKASDHSIHIVGNNFEGVIFKDNYFENPNDTSASKIKRFTPSNEDVLLIENIMRAEKQDKQNGSDRKYIFNNLKKYRRQYIGYFNNKGERVIYINCFSFDEDLADKKMKSKQNLFIPTWYNSFFRVFDGGKSFWQISINLKTKSIINMSINGLA